MFEDERIISGFAGGGFFVVVVVTAIATTVHPIKIQVKVTARTFFCAGLSIAI
jgi:hypothetical protein